MQTYLDKEMEAWAGGLASDDPLMRRADWHETSGARRG